MKYITLRQLFSLSFIVGSLDILAAFIQTYLKTGKGPQVVLLYIASGIFGKAAFKGGAAMILAGLAAHYLIAFLFTLFFFFVAPLLFKKIKSSFAIAFLYGLFIWLVMQLVVLPLSQVPKLPMTFASAITAILILAICIGLPLALFANRKAPALIRQP